MKLSRRSFLQALGIGGLAIPLVGRIGCAGSSGPHPQDELIVAESEPLEKLTPTISSCRLMHEHIVIGDVASIDYQEDYPTFFDVRNEFAPSGFRIETGWDSIGNLKAELFSFPEEGLIFLRHSMQEAAFKNFDIHFLDEKPMRLKFKGLIQAIRYDVSEDSYPKIHVEFKAKDSAWS